MRLVSQVNIALYTETSKIITEENEPLKSHLLRVVASHFDFLEQIFNTQQIVSYLLNRRETDRVLLQFS